MDARGATDSGRTRDAGPSARDRTGAGARRRTIRAREKRDRQFVLTRSRTYSLPTVAASIVPRRGPTRRDTRPDRDYALHGPVQRAHAAPRAVDVVVEDLDATQDIDTRQETLKLCVCRAGDGRVGLGWGLCVSAALPPLVRPRGRPGSNADRRCTRRSTSRTPRPHDRVPNHITAPRQHGLNQSRLARAHMSSVSTSLACTRTRSPTPNRLRVRI